MVHRSIKALVVFLAIFGSGVTDAALTIMPVGDSNTTGYHGPPEIRGAYRNEMEMFLNAIAFDFDFVGRYHQATDGLVDGDMQAIRGINVQQMVDIFPDSIAEIQPDVALILAGTNNHIDDPATSDFEQLYDSLLGVFREHSPATRIVVATIPRFGCCQDEDFWTEDWVAERNDVRFPLMNEAIEKLAASDPQVESVDLYGVIDPSIDLVPEDWVHLNRLGQQKFSHLYLQTLLSVDYGLIRTSHLDQFHVQIHSELPDVALDLDGSGDVTQQDVSVFLKDFVKTTRGDANLDGAFNSTDLIEVFQVGHYEDQNLMNSTWATGDWNGDREFTSADFVAALSDGGYDVMGKRAVTRLVPEPHFGWIAVVAFGWLLLGARPPHDVRSKRRLTVDAGHLNCQAVMVSFRPSLIVT